MGYFRFRKTFKLGPIRLNVNKKSVSASIGPRGLGLTVGTAGGSAHVGLPGTGLSYIMPLYRKRPRTYGVLSVLIIVVIIGSVLSVIL